MKRLIIRLLSPMVNPVFLLRSIPRYWAFWKDYFSYKRMIKEKGVKANMEILPCIHEKDEEHVFDAEYFYQSYWALSKIIGKCPSKHTDLGSDLRFVNALCVSIAEVDFLDIRKLDINIPNLKFVLGNILDLPMETNSISSLSCLHVVEHIGLGRYGDPLNPNGTFEALQEIQRVVKKDGLLLLSTPIGRETVCFNAHRISDPVKVVNAFDKMTLVSFSIVYEGKLLNNVNFNDYKDIAYGCGLFEFIKNE